MDVAATQSAQNKVVAALHSASARTGAEFDYLYKTALRESGLKTTAKAPTSSATGLFQFIEQTWFETFKQSGHKHGLGNYADDITRGRDGRYKVADPAVRREILALRNDPVVAAVMAGELTSANRLELTAALGRAPSDGELYIGHFLGPRGAAKLVRAAASDNARPAAELFPGAARANRAIFYDRSGEARSAGDVYRILVAKHSGEAAPPKVAVDTRERSTPFAGIIAFFEYLFSGPKRDLPEAPPEVPQRQSPQLQVAPQPQAPVPPAGLERAPGLAPVAAYGPVEDHRISAAGAAQLFALRAANSAYGALPAGNAHHAQEVAGDDPSAPAAQLWGGGLFTNASRPSGPLILIGSPLAR